MAEIQTLTATLSADVAQFLAGMQAAQAHAAQVNNALDRLASAASTAAHAHDEHAEAVAKSAENMSAAGQAAEGASEALGRMAQQFTIANLAAAAVEKAVELIKEVAAECINAAAAAQMTSVQFNAAFGTSATEVGEWSERVAKDIGRSGMDMEKLVTQAKYMADGMGVGSESANDMAEGLAKMAANMSIARGVPLESAMQALSMALIGSTRGMRQFGVVISPARQNLEAFKEGLGDTYAKLTQAEQAQVNYNLIMQSSEEVTRRADAAAGTYVNRVASMKSTFDEAAEHIGSGALPMLTSLADGVNVLAKAFDGLSNEAKGWGAALAFGPLGVAIKQAQEIESRLEGLVRSDHGAGAGGAAGNLAGTALREMEQHEKELRAEGEAFKVKQRAEDAAALEALHKKVEEYEKARTKALQEQFAMEDEIQRRHQAGVAVLEAAAQKELQIRQKIADLQIKAAEQAAAAQHQQLKDARTQAELEVAAAEKARSRAQSAGSGKLADLTAAVNAAYEKVRAAAEQAVSDDNQRLADLAGQLAIAQAYAASVMNFPEKELKAQEEINKLKLEQYLRQKELNNDERDLQRAKEKYQDHWQKQLSDYQANQGLGNAGAKLAGATQFGRMAQDVSAASAGGPAAMAAAAGVDLILASEGGKKAIAAADKIFQQLADCIGKVVEPLVPIIEALGSALKPIFDGLGAVLAQIGKAVAAVIKPLLAPLIALMKPVGDLLGAVAPLISPLLQLTSIFSTIFTAFDPLTMAMRSLAPAVELLAKGTKIVVDAIARVWNSILHVLEGVMDSLAHALPSGAGDAMRDVYNALVGMEIHADAASTALDTTGMAARDAARAQAEYALSQDMARVRLFQQMGYADLAAQAQAQADARQQEISAIDGTTAAMVQLSQATIDAAKAWGDANKRVQADREKAASDYAAYKYLMSTGQKDAAAQALKAYHQDQAQAQADAIAAEIARVQEEISQYGSGAFESGSHSGNNGMTLAAELAKLQRDQAVAAAVANTSATVANTKATNSLIASLTNAPSGFRAAMYEYAASSVSSSRNPALTGAAQKVAGQTVQHGGIINGPVTIQVVSTDPATAGKAVEKTLREWNFRTSGQPVLAGGGKHA